ncbi:MAG: UbiX family flavin prenyltransferase [Coriobacteriia bacterium]|nr:UbiX family flavin prenyltransferase [Coriobacteriia bacterium]
MARIALIMTGASGSAYGMRITEQLLVLGHEVVFCATTAGREVCAYELGFELPSDDAATAATALGSFLELPGVDRLRVAMPQDLFDPIASGSHQLDAVIVAPASMGFCASVAAGLASDLAQRAADVALKEHRPLVVMPRETPLSLVHLRSLTALTEAGAIIVPAMPAFYQRPSSIDDMVSFMAGKVLDVLGIEHALFTRWGDGEQDRA